MEDFLDLAKKKWAVVSQAKKLHFLKQNKTNKRKAKDPKAPKKSLSPYMFFSQDYRRKMEKGSSGSRGGGFKLVGQAWQQLGQEEKEPFFEMAEKDKIRYQHELEKYHADNPKKEVTTQHFVIKTREC